MLQVSDAFREAIVGSPREMEIFAVVDLSDPDMQLLPVTSSGQAPWSRSDQLGDFEADNPARYATLEDGLWLLDGSFDLFPDDYSAPEHVGFAGDVLSGSRGEFSEPFPWIQFNFTGVRVLQAYTLLFPSDPIYGYPLDLIVEVWSNDQLVYSDEVSGNTETDLIIRGFTVYNATAFRLTVKRWSLPCRRVRLNAAFTGLFERWTGDDLEQFNVVLQGQFSCLSMPYGSATVAMDNADRRFEPRRKDSIFQSITERQGVDLYLGCRTVYGMERVKLGIFYQSGDGWKTSSNELTMRWYLVDIIGLLANRTFIVPARLPITLEGWLNELAGQLGDNFRNRYHVDPNYANKPVVANNRADVTGKKCGDILKWACQASGTWARADQETGDLTAEPLWDQGNKYTLDNLVSYPAMRANESLAALIFQLATEEGNQEFVVSGNSTTSEKTVTIINPFLHTTQQALAAARLILAQYGGNVYELTGRGDPSSEIGDVDTIWLDESNAATARRMSQTFQFQAGVLQNCRSTLINADGSYLWTEFVVFRKDGIFETPPDVHELRIVLGDGGQGSGPGGPGWIGRTDNLGSTVGSGYGDDGVDGQGGAVLYMVIPCNDGQQFVVHLGAGGAPGTVVGQAGALGGHTTFGAYSSENGRIYANGYTDIANGQVFCRPGVELPLPGTGDGAKGGKGGDPGEGYLEAEEYTPIGADPSVVNTRYHLIVTKQPGQGAPGVRGATGFVMVTWQKPESEL